MKPGSLHLQPQFTVLPSLVLHTLVAATGPLTPDTTLLLACPAPVWAQGVCLRLEGPLHRPSHTDTQLTPQGAREAWLRRRQAGRPGRAMWEVKAGCPLGHFQRECQCPQPLPSCLGAGMGLWEMSVSQGPWASLTLLRTRIRPSWAPTAPAMPPPLPPA